MEDLNMIREALQVAEAVVMPIPEGPNVKLTLKINQVFKFI